MISKTTTIFVTASFALFVLKSAEGAILTDVLASGYTSLNLGVTQTPIEVTKAFLSGGVQSITGSGSISAFAGNLSVSYTAATIGFAQAGPGMLKARVTTEAVAASFEPNVPALLFSPRANAGYQARYSELVELKHPTLPIGTPVVYRGTLTVDVVTNEPMFPTGSFSLQYVTGPEGGPFDGAGYSFPNGLFRSVPSLNFSQVFDVSARVGQKILTSTSLSLGGTSKAGPDGFGGTFGRQNRTFIDASNTIGFFLDPITPGLEFLSESGHDYRSSLVPLPGAFALLISAVGAFGLIIRSPWLTISSRVKRKDDQQG